MTSSLFLTPSERLPNQEIMAEVKSDLTMELDINLLHTPNRWSAPGEVQSLLGFSVHSVRIFMKRQLIVNDHTKIQPLKCTCP